MLKHYYDHIYVTSGSGRRDFDPKDRASLRAAVEYLRTVPQTSHVALVVDIRVKAGTFRVQAPASLNLSEIIGKTPHQIWQIFDAEIDRQITYFERRGV